MRQENHLNAIVCGQRARYARTSTPEPSSAMISSQFFIVCATTDSIAAGKYRKRLYVGRTIEMSGRDDMVHLPEGRPRSRITAISRARRCLSSRARRNDGARRTCRRRLRRRSCLTESLRPMTSRTRMTPRLNCGRVRCGARAGPRATRSRRDLPAGLPPCLRVRSSSGTTRGSCSRQFVRSIPCKRAAPAFVLRNRSRPT